MRTKASISASGGAAGQLLDGDDQRRVADDAGLAVDEVRQLGERLEAVLGPRLGQVLLGALRLLRLGQRRHTLQGLLDVQARVPEVERPHSRELGHRLAIRAADGQVHGLALLVVEAAISPGDGEAGHEPLDVPLERPGKRLVEVVQAEDQSPIRRGKHAEVRQVGIAAELRLETGARGRREVGGHEVRRAAVERERRHEHAPVPDRDELGHPGRRLLLEQLDRIASPCRRLPFAEHRALDLRPGGPTSRRPLGSRRVRDLAAAIPAAIGPSGRPGPRGLHDVNHDLPLSHCLGRAADGIGAGPMPSTRPNTTSVSGPRSRCLRARSGRR